MDCQKAKSQLSDHIDNRLGAGEKLLLEAHLAACAGCAAEFGRLRAAVGALRELPIETMPVDAARRLRERLGFSEEVQQPRFQISRWLASPIIPVAATAIILLAVLSVIFHGNRPAATTAPLRAKSPVIIAEFSQSDGQEPNGGAAKPPAANTRSFGSENGPVKALRGMSKNSASAASPLVKIGSKDYGSTDVEKMLEIDRQHPDENYQIQAKGLREAAGASGHDLNRALNLAHQKLPGALPIYAERARYQGQPVWIIILRESSGRKALVIKAGPAP